ncbi:MAG: autotransporter outer membrane beta-barrel domain-containing protein, partial [Brucella intermedia]
MGPGRWPPWKHRPGSLHHQCTLEDRFFKLQAGIDGLLHDDENGKLIGGITAHYDHGRSRVSSFYGDGKIETDAYGLGATLIWYGNEGFYIDAQGGASWFHSDLSSLLANRSLTDGNEGFGYALSIET